MTRKAVAFYTVMLSSETVKLVCQHSLRYVVKEALVFLRNELYLNKVRLI